MYSKSHWPPHTGHTSHWPPHTGHTSHWPPHTGHTSHSPTCGCCLPTAVRRSCISFLTSRHEESIRAMSCGIRLDLDYNDVHCTCTQYHTLGTPHTGHTSHWAHLTLGTPHTGHTSHWAHLTLGTPHTGHTSHWAHLTLAPSHWAHLTLPHLWVLLANGRQEVMYQLPHQST